MKIGLLGMVSPMTVCIAEVPDDVTTGLFGCAANDKKTTQRKQMGQDKTDKKKKKVRMRSI